MLLLALMFEMFKLLISEALPYLQKTLHWILITNSCLACWWTQHTCYQKSIKMFSCLITEQFYTLLLSIRLQCFWTMFTYGFFFAWWSFKLHLWMPHWTVFTGRFLKVNMWWFLFLMQCHLKVQSSVLILSLIIWVQILQILINSWWCHVQ